MSAIATPSPSAAPAVMTADAPTNDQSRAAFWPRTFEVGCTIDVVHTFDSLDAHVALDGDVALGPGDKVRVHGAPIAARFGESFTLRRRASVRKAGWIGRAWTRLTSRLELTELYEVSFTPRRTL